MRTIDFAPDLGARIGTPEWARGAATCAALCGAAMLLAPPLDHTIPGASPPALAGASWEETRSQSVAPLAWGGTTGRRMGSNDLVRPLAHSPERPVIELTATLGSGDSVTRTLARAGLDDAEAAQVYGLIEGALEGEPVKPGTLFDIRLGRRPDPASARPLERLAFRARFDLNLAVVRDGDSLTVDRTAIAIDHTPLRIRGLAGTSLYRAARAAGAPAKAVETYLRALATRLPVGQIDRDSQFDIIIERARAATGEVQLGNLVYAGLTGGKRKVQLMRWQDDGRTDWFEASGVGEKRGQVQMPVLGRLASTFGVRRHPILGFLRMHKGLDIAAPHGTPIRAAIDGVVAFTGRHGGYGNFVKLNHAGGFASGYGHMSRIAVRAGTRVSQGDVIGYVGSTGMSTGPHLHWELWKNGAAINPRSVSFIQSAQLSGPELRAFRARLGELMAVGTAGK